MKTVSTCGRLERFNRRLTVLACVAVTIISMQRLPLNSALGQLDIGNGLTLGMRHDILQRHDPFRPNPSELPKGSFRWGTYDAGSPFNGGWFWHLTNPGELPVNQMNPLPKVPPGLVYGLHSNPDHLVNWHPDLAHFFHWDAKDVLAMGYRKCHARDGNRPPDEGLNWLVTTETAFVAPYPWHVWYQLFVDIYFMPHGTMIGLMHSKHGNQKTTYGNQNSGNKYVPVWWIMVNNVLYPIYIDPTPKYTNTSVGFVSKAIMHVLGFDIKHGGDSGLDDGEGFYWYEKVAPPFTRVWE